MTTIDPALISALVDGELPPADAERVRRAIAADPTLYAETLANLPDPDADAALEQWLAEYGVEATTPDPAGAWSLG